MTALRAPAGKPAGLTRVMLARMADPRATGSRSAQSDGTIVVTGEALIDLVLARDGSLDGHPGGGPYNVARTIGRLEQPVRYLGRISTDGFGRRLLLELEAAGVDLDSVIATDAPTTLALAELDAAGAARYHFYEDGTSAPGLTVEAASAAVPEQLAIFYLGTLGLVFEPMASALEALVARLGDDTLVALDPNCRPTMIADPAAFRGRLARLLARTDVLKASEEDLDWIDPGSDPVAAARSLLAQDGAVALVTRGGDGAVVVTPERAIEVRSPAVEVVDTIGAGDAFMGGFLADWRSRGLGRSDLRRLDELERAAMLACRVAAITCSRAGADPPRLTEL
jgi:fructokinase